MVMETFYGTVLRDYERNLDIFFDPETGAVYEPGRDDGTPAFLFAEVTGYAVMDYLLLYNLTGNRRYIDKANKSASWIRDRAQSPTGGILTRYYLERDTDSHLADKSFAGHRIHAFDTAICLRGMVALYAFTKNAAYLDSAVRMGDFLLETAMRPGGHVIAIYDGKKGEPATDDRSKWSKCFGAFHSKVAEALIDLYEVTTRDRYAEAAHAICERALGFQSPQGNFETSMGLTELHPHCYAAEGLLHVGVKAKNTAFISAARRATEWALGRCSDGEIAQVFTFSTGTPLSRFRTDALAQVLALAADLYRMGQLEQTHSSTIDALAAKVLTMKTGPGGYYRYGYYEREFNGKYESDTRSYWTNMFCLRGLHKYYRSRLLDNTYVILLAGGIGSRAWPISCENRPKPVSLAFLGSHSLLQETLRRYTHDHFIRPERIFILCSANALEQASRQAEQEGVPPSNCLIEDEPRGTIPAVSLALDGIPKGEASQDRLLIVTMGDNVIDPYLRFQAAVTTALFAARENDCIVSVGKPLDEDAGLDERFGHLIYTQKISSYNVFEVERFVEKPKRETFPIIKDSPGSIAWECGTVVFRESYYRNLIPQRPKSGNLAENILSKALPWSSKEQGGVKLATSLLDPATRFEDFGVPGENLKRFYRGNPKYDIGDGNICLSSQEGVRMLSCSNNLVFADELPLELYGLDGYLVIDNAVTNTAVMMPLSEVHHLPNLYRLFTGSRAYEPFVSGGPAAVCATPTTFVEKSPQTHARSSFGLVFVFNVKEPIHIERHQHGLRVLNETYPEVGQKDFNTLFERQKEDPRLVEHLIHVGALAKAFVGGHLVLSDVAREILNKVCLYHAIGGCLTDEGERREERAMMEFQEISRLNRRLLDSRIISEMVRLYRSDDAATDSTLAKLINENVNSAVQFLKTRTLENSSLRDIAVALLQAQDNPHLFAAFRKELRKTGPGDLERELDPIFASFKIAKNFSNGRWLWKRERFFFKAGRHSLQYKRGLLEDLPFVVSFCITWLRSAEIDPKIYVNRINELLVGDDSTFLRIIQDLQQSRPFLICDDVYRCLLANRNGSLGTVRQLLEDGIVYCGSHEAQYFQLPQILELPFVLETIATHCDALTKETVNMVKEAVIHLYHQHWKLIKPHVSLDIVARLVA